MADYGAARAKADYWVSKEQLQTLQRPWVSEETNTAELAQRSLRKPSVLKAFISAFGTLVNIFPPRRRREVYMPASTVEEDVRQAWKAVGRATVDVTRTYGIPGQ